MNPATATANASDRPARAPAPLTPAAQAEAELVARVRAGDPLAFEQVVRQYGGRLLAVARRILRCEEDCADAVQDAFLSAFKSAHEFAGTSALGTWLHRIAVNACLMHLRRRKDETSIEPLLPTFTADGHHARHVRAWEDCGFETAVRAETGCVVRDAIDRLPSSYRTVLVLRDIEELDTEETARLLNCTRGNVKTRLHRARQALKILLDNTFDNVS
jgi:RNA polymerase sigma-70 factor (ECF subfamily)